MSTELKRKILRRDDFGLCVLLPKTAWSAAPEPGGTLMANVNGDRRRLRVRSESCTCGGHPLHEHRFLSLPAGCGLRADQRCTIALK